MVKETKCKSQSTHTPAADGSLYSFNDQESGHFHKSARYSVIDGSMLPFTACKCSVHGCVNTANSLQAAGFYSASIICMGVCVCRIMGIITSCITDFLIKSYGMNIESSVFLLYSLPKKILDYFPWEKTSLNIC